MRDKDKPFVVYRKGPGNFTIVPRGVKGWMQFCLWLALLVPLIYWITEYAREHSGEEFFTGLVLFCVGILAWIIGGIWWSLARAEVVNSVELQRRRYMEKRRRRRGDGDAS